MEGATPLTHLVLAETSMSVSSQPVDPTERSACLDGGVDTLPDVSDTLPDVSV